MKQMKNSTQGFKKWTLGRLFNLIPTHLFCDILKVERIAKKAIATDQWNNLKLVKKTLSWLKG